MIVSPVSAQTAAALAMIGTAGETIREMLTRLQCPPDAREGCVQQNFKLLNDNLRKTNGLKIGEKWLAVDLTSRHFHILL